MLSDFESKSKESDKRTQALSSKQIRTMSPQEHEIYSVEIVKTASENEKNNNEDDRSESEQIMVPSGKCLYRRMMCESYIFWTH